ncbi:MAG: hypothetical protein KAJ42_12260 [Gemmatimonadetes bacterium]|nr:hypothetical protein [Gemmatimonadota bacterium]
MFIRDPITSQGARVANGRLRTEAISESLEADASRQGEAFTLATSQSVRTLTVVAANDGPLLYVRNLSEAKILVADGFTATEDGPGGILYIVKNPVLAAIGANVPIVASNRNFSSTREASVEAEVWDETGVVGLTGLSGGEEVASFIRPVPAGTLDLKNAVRLGRLDSAYFGFQNPTGGPIEASIAFRFHMEDIEVFT